LVTEVSGQIFDPIFRGQTVPKLLNSLILEDETNSSSRNFNKYRSTLRNIPEDRKYHLHRGGSLKARINYTNLCSN